MQTKKKHTRERNENYREERKSVAQALRQLFFNLCDFALVTSGCFMRVASVKMNY